MGKKKIIIDNNVLISGLGWNGTPRIILEQVIAGKYVFLISNKQMEELRKVLTYPKFKFTKKQIEKYIKLIQSISLCVLTKTKIQVIKEDPADNMFLELAHETGADYIITGDMHLLKLKKYNKTDIINPQYFLKLSKENIKFK